MRGLDVAREESIPLGDGILMATALENKLPVVVSSDRHVEKAASKLGLILENPLSTNLGMEALIRLRQKAFKAG